MSSRAKKKALPRPPREKAPAESSFERRFRVAARRVLRRRGVPEDRIEAEISKLKRLKPRVALPTVADLEKALAESADTR